MAEVADLGEMVLHLTGDGSKYRKMIKDAVQITEDGAKTVETAATRMEQVQKVLGGVGGIAPSISGLLGALGSAHPAVAAAAGAFDSLQSILQHVRDISKEDAAGIEDFQSHIENFPDLLSEAAAPIVGFVSDLGLWLDANEGVRESLGGILVLLASGIAVVTAAVASFKALGFSIAILDTLITALRIKLLINTAAFVTWKAVVILAAVPVTLFNIQLAVWNTLLGANVGATASWSIVTVVATAATWLWNAALAVLTVQISPAVFLAAVGTIALLTAGITLAGLATYALYESAVSVFNILTSIPEVFSGDKMIGPLEHIKSLLGEWLGIIQEVIAAVGVDMGLAWKLLQAGLELALAQIKSMWPPLWEYIKAGFNAIWIATVKVFRVSFLEGIAEVLAATSAISPAFAVEAEHLEGVRKKAAEVRAEAVADAAKALGAAADVFGEVEESFEEVVKRVALERVRADIAAFKKETPATDLPTVLSEVAAVVKSAPDVTGRNAVAFGSAEALARINDYRQKSMVDLLQMAVKHLDVIAKKKPAAEIAFEGADLGAA